MGMREKIKGCLRCGHEWVSRKERPYVCPKCKSPYWNVPKKLDKNPE